MRTGLIVLVAWILLSVPVGIMVGRWLARSGREYPEAVDDPVPDLPDPGWRDITSYVRTVRLGEGTRVHAIDWPRVGQATITLDNDLRRCACPLAEAAERILHDDRLCAYRADGDDGLCSGCRVVCVPLLDEIQRKAPHGV